MKLLTYQISALVVVAVGAIWGVAIAVTAVPAEATQVDGDDRPIVALWRQHDGLTRD